MTRYKRVYKNVPSNYPFYVVALLWAVGCFILPMYKLFSFIVLAVISVIAFIVMRMMKVFPDEQVEVETPITYANKMVEELSELGFDQIDDLNTLDHKISDEKVSGKIQEVITIQKQVLKYIDKHPDQAKNTRKYFKYYVSNVVDLLKQYQEMEESQMDGDHITSSKQKIESTLDLSLQAFTKFYDSLYENTSMEVNVDSKVLEDLFKQEGII